MCIAHLNYNHTTLVVLGQLVKTTPLLHPRIAYGHLAHQHYDDDGEELPPNKRQRGGRRMERPRGVAAQFRSTDVSDVKEVRECCSSLSKRDRKIALQERVGRKRGREGWSKVEGESV